MAFEQVEGIREDSGGQDNRKSVMGEYAIQSQQKMAWTWR